MNGSDLGKENRQEIQDTHIYTHTHTFSLLSLSQSQFNSTPPSPSPQFQPSVESPIVKLDWKGRSRQAWLDLTDTVLSCPVIEAIPGLSFLLSPFVSRLASSTSSCLILRSLNLRVFSLPHSLILPATPQPSQVNHASYKTSQQGRQGSCPDIATTTPVLHYFSRL